MTGVGAMHEAAIQQPAWVLLAYLIAGVCFILALRGLSGPESSRRGNRVGMLGMLIAVVTTLVSHYRSSMFCVDPAFNAQAELAACRSAPPGNEIELAWIALAVLVGGAVG